MLREAGRGTRVRTDEPEREDNGALAVGVRHRQRCSDWSRRRLRVCH